jgi:hypothetical protein
MFSYSPGRGAQHAQKLYAGVQPGTALMTDGYELYNGIAHDQSPNLGALIQLRLPHDVGPAELQFPGVKAVGRDAQPLRHIRHRMTPFGYLFDCLDLELIRVPLAAHPDLLGCHKLWLEDVYERLAGPKELAPAEFARQVVPSSGSARPETPQNSL